MSQPKPTQSAQFLTGLAWTLLIVAAWASLRLGLWLTLSIVNAEAEHSLLGIQPPFSHFLAGAHIALAGFTVYAASAMLKRRPWTQKYFAGLLLLIALEAIAFGIFFIFQAQSAADEIKSLKIAAGIPIILLGLIAILVATKLLRDKRIQAEFPKEHD